MIIRDNFFKSVCRDPSSELSCQDSSDEGSQHMVSMRDKKNYPLFIIEYLFLFIAP